MKDPPQATLYVFDHTGMLAWNVILTTSCRRVRLRNDRFTRVYHGRSFAIPASDLRPADARESAISYSGMHLLRTGAPTQPFIATVDRDSPAYRAGVRTGDVVACLGSPRNSAILFAGNRGSPSPYVAGRVFTPCIVRGGVQRSVRIVPERRPAVGFIYGKLWVALLRAAVFGVFLLVGALLVIARPSPLTWIFFAYCLASDPSYAFSINGTTHSPVTYTVLTFLVTGLVRIGGCLMLLFALIVPEDRAVGAWRVVACRVTWAALAALVGVMAAASFHPDTYVAAWVFNDQDSILTAAIVVVLGVRLVAARGESRARLGWAALAIVLGIVINDVRSRTGAGEALSDLTNIAGVLTIVMPLALMYAILKRHIIDVRFIISRTVVYAAITTIVVGIIGAVDWATSVYLAQARVAMAIDAAVTIGLGFVLHRAYGRLEYAVDFLLFRDKHEAQEYLARLGRTLQRAKREETVDRALVHDPYEKLGLSMAALFRTEGSAAYALSCAAGWDRPNAQALDPDHDLVRFLLTERKTIRLSDLRAHVASQLRENDTQPAIVIPIFESDDLAAFALYGIHRDGTQLDPDEVQTLEALCDAAAHAYTRVENLRYRSLVQSPATV